MSNTTMHLETVLRHRGRYDRNFTIIHNDIALAGAQLSCRAKGLALHLWALPEDAPIDSLTLTRQLKEGRDAIRAMLNELIAAGFLRRTRESVGKGQWRHVVEVADRPVFAGRNTDGFSGPENPTVGSSGDKDLKDFDSSTYTHTARAVETSTPPTTASRPDGRWSWLHGEPSLSPALKAVVEAEPVSEVDLGDLRARQEVIDRVAAEPELGDELHAVQANRRLVLCLREIPGWPADDAKDLALVGEVTEAAGSRWSLPSLVDRFLEWARDDSAALRPRGLRTRFRRHCVDAPGHVLDDLEEEPDVRGWLEAHRDERKAS